MTGDAILSDWLRGQHVDREWLAAPFSLAIVVRIVDLASVLSAARSKRRCCGRRYSVRAARTKCAVGSWREFGTGRTTADEY